MDEWKKDDWLWLGLIENSVHTTNTKTYIHKYTHTHPYICIDLSFCHIPSRCCFCCCFFIITCVYMYIYFTFCLVYCRCCFSYCSYHSRELLMTMVLLLLLVVVVFICSSGSKPKLKRKKGNNNNETSEDTETNGSREKNMESNKNIKQKRQRQQQEKKIPTSASQSVIHPSILKAGSLNQKWKKKCTYNLLKTANDYSHYSVFEIMLVVWKVTQIPN